MQGTFTLNRKAIAMKAAISAAAAAAAVILPQLFHAIGTISGTGASVGSALLPMHLPVILCGFIAGPAAGLIAGILSPFVSFMISGMPSAVILPFMVLELGAYGLVSGLLSKTRLNTFASLIITQLSGRLVRGAAVLVSVYALGSTALTAAAAYTFILEGIFGIIIQWAIVPAAVSRMEVLKKHYE